jgi:transcriptional regulator with XRE-family HTH domain
MSAHSQSRMLVSHPNKSSDFKITSRAENEPAEIIVGLKIRDLRNKREYSLRTLADLSGLNINTLSMIENSKSSPSVSTLQQLARALEVPITAFFESEPVSKRIVFTKHDRRPEAIFGNARMQNLGKDLAGNTVQPFVVILEPGTGSGDRMIVHTGVEFVYCLSGRVLYIIDNIKYILASGDSVVFESHFPHQWNNMGKTQSQIILILYPGDQREELGRSHFMKETKLLGEK